MDDYIVSAEQAAAILGMNAKTLRQMLRDIRPSGARQVPPIKGGNWFLRQSYIDELAAQRRRTIAPAATHSRAESSELVPALEQARQRRVVPVKDTVVLPHGVWSDWVPFGDALPLAPRYPGVYMFRLAKDPARGPVYIGMAGERKGNGVRGRLAIYASGKGAGSGLGEHAFDRALEDPVWLQARLDEARAGNPMRAKEAARSAIDHLGLEVRWQTVASRAEALQLEGRLIGQYRSHLWNR